MTAKIKSILVLTLVLILAAMIFSCKSSFPAAGTPVDCNGQLLIPVLNPTQRAHFPGEKDALSQFLQANLKYPQEVTDRKIEGKIRVAFIVTREGGICDIRITSKPKEFLDDEVIRVIKMMPEWVPAINDSETVDSYYLLDILL